MRIKLKYGVRGLSVNLPETPGFVGVLSPKKTPVLRNPRASLAKMLREPIGSPPLAELASGKKTLTGECGNSVNYRTQERVGSSWRVGLDALPGKPTLPAQVEEGKGG